MRNLFSSRPLRFLFAANFVSMVGSGMNTAAVNWYILQATRSEELLGMLVVAQALPSLLLMPFSGVIVDREDRRHVVMFLDAARALLILAVAGLALYGTVQVWLLFVMSVLVSMGFWMFWPTITALLQELTPEGQFAQSNALLLAGFQAGSNHRTSKLKLEERIDKWCNPRVMQSDDEDRKQNKYRGDWYEPPLLFLLDERNEL